VWVSAIFFVNKIPKGRQEKKSDVLNPNSKNSLKFTPSRPFLEEHVVTALSVG
jgi:hypothetical protein